MRYVCKNCGRFVSQSAPICKCCNTENPAVPQGERTSRFESASSIENGNRSGKSEEKPHNSLKIAFGIIVIAIIIINIGISISKFKSTTATMNSNVDEIAVSQTVEGLVDEPTVQEYSNSTPHKSTEKNQPSSNSDFSNTNIDLIYKVDGSTDSEYYWTIRIINGKKLYQYIVLDPYIDEETISISGKWYMQTFEELKAEHPTLRLRNCNISPSKQIIMIGSVGSYGGRTVDGIIVPAGKYAELYFNDDDDPMEFFLIDRLIRLN